MKKNQDPFKAMTASAKKIEKAENLIIQKKNGLYIITNGYYAVIASDHAYKGVFRPAAACFVELEDGTQAARHKNDIMPHTAPMNGNGLFEVMIKGATVPVEETPFLQTAEKAVLKIFMQDKSIIAVNNAYYEILESFVPGCRWIQQANKKGSCAGIASESIIHAGIDEDFSFAVYLLPVRQDIAGLPVTITRKEDTPTPGAAKGRAAEILQEAEDEARRIKAAAKAEAEAEAARIKKEAAENTGYSVRECEAAITDAQNRAAHIIAEAEKKAAEIKASTEDGAEIITDAAKAEADKIIKAAEAGAEQTRRTAEAEADHIKEQAAEAARKMILEAQKAIEAEAAQPVQVHAAEDQKQPGAVIKRNEDKNGIEIYFNSFPTAAVREQLKADGFRWHSGKKCWYAKATAEHIATAERIAA